MSTCRKFQCRAGARSNESSKLASARHGIVKMVLSSELCYVFVPLVVFPVILLNATANYSCFMSPISHFHYADAKCTVIWMCCHSHALSLPEPPCAYCRVALFWMVNRSTLIRFPLGLGRHSPPAWFWAFVCGNNIKTILQQLKLSLCLSHF